MLTRRLRRRPNINPALDQCIVFADRPLTSMSGGSVLMGRAMIHWSRVTLIRRVSRPKPAGLPAITEYGRSPLSVDARRFADHTLDRHHTGALLKNGIPIKVDARPYLVVNIMSKCRVCSVVAVQCFGSGGVHRRVLLWLLLGRLLHHNHVIVSHGETFDLQICSLLAWNAKVVTRVISIGYMFSVLSFMGFTLTL